MSKTVVITGASDGLGLETAKILVEKGWRVVSISRSKPTDKRIEHIRADLSKKDEIDSCVKIVREKYSDFTVLINNASIIKKHKISEIDYDEFKQVLDVNVVASTYLVSGLVELIKNNQATIVNIVSTVGLKAYEDQAAYGISKWATRGLSEYLRLELKPFKCRVINFNPGGMVTKFFEKNLGETFDQSKYMDPKEMAKFLVQTIELPNNMEVSDVTVNRVV